MKEQIKQILKSSAYEELHNLPGSRKRILTHLISLTYDKKDPLAWRAVEAIGEFTGELAKSDPEAVRHTAERLLWMIRDESGGIGWSAPEILGEIVRNNQSLCSDIAPIIVSFHDEPPLRAGVFRAVGRIGKTNTEMVQYAGPILISALRCNDSTVQGNAAWALGELGHSEAYAELEALKNETAQFSLYEKGELREKSVGEVAREAIGKIKE